MKSLIGNYIKLLNIDKLREFAIKNNINLSNKELEYILNLIKNNYEDILINDEKYLNMIKDNVNNTEYEKIKNLYLHYKKKYKGYLF